MTAPVEADKEHHDTPGELIEDILQPGKLIPLDVYAVIIGPLEALVDKAVVAARIEEANYYLANRDFTRMTVGKSVIKDRLSKLKAIMEIKE